MTLAAGSRLGPYEIVAPVGAGGMGEVYRARDTRLGREVAVKILPVGLSGDPDRLARFKQEARAVSALNHPNVLTVHDFRTESEAQFLVTELLEGESVRSLLRRGPLAPQRAAEIAIHVARGLAAAHDRGVVHRDLKPDNVFLTREGVAKILDFGLALMDSAEAAAGDLQEASTRIETMAGTVVGTIGYMAPEQVRGERADERSDLFSLGVVLHEMVSGSNPFRRELGVESLSAIVHDEPPDLAESRPGTPPALARIVARLLAKDPERRFRSSHDLVFALEGVGTASTTRQPSLPPPDPVRRGPWPLAAAALGIAAAALLAGWWLGAQGTREGAGPGRSAPVRFEIHPPEGGSFPVTAEMHNFALSPDGRTLAVVVGLGGTRGLYLRELSDIEFRVLAGSEGAASPFWSPDGSELAFFAGGKLKRVAREGGPVQVVCEVQGSNTGAWGRGGTILFSQGFGPDNGLFRVAAAGGAPVRLESAADLPRWMELLPDGRRFLYWDRADDALSGKVYLADLETGESRLLLDVTSQVRYAPAGWLVYVRDEALVAQRFDAERGEVTGDPIALAANVAHFFNGWAALSVAGPAALAYQVDAPPQPLLWLDRHGRDIGRVGPVARAISARLSPDGQSAAVVWSDPASTFTDLWIVDLVRGGATRVSEEALLAWSPVWSPEGDRVAYTATSPGPEFKVVVRRVSDGETLASLPAHDNFFWPRGWGPAGIFLDRNQGRTRWDLWRWPALEAEAGPLLETEFNETLGSPSPDGRWLALHSLESGEGEIELLPLRSPGRRVRVSRGAQGVVPRWSGDGRELFFVSAEGWLSVVSIGTGDSPIISEPEPLFEIELVNETAIDVSADGERFLVAATTPNSALPITVALDWQGDLPRP